MALCIGAVVSTRTRHVRVVRCDLCAGPGVQAGVRVAVPWSTQVGIVSYRIFRPPAGQINTRTH